MILDAVAILILGAVVWGAMLAVLLIAHPEAEQPTPPARPLPVPVAETPIAVMPYTDESPYVETQIHRYARIARETAAASA